MHTTSGHSFMLIDHYWEIEFASQFLSKKRRITLFKCIATMAQKPLATADVNHKVDWCSRFLDCQTRHRLAEWQEIL